MRRTVILVSAIMAFAALWITPVGLAADSRDPRAALYPPFGEKPGGENPGVTGGGSGPDTVSASAGDLPFTGSELGLFALAGFALVGSGFVLRRSSRADQ